MSDKGIDLGVCICDSEAALRYYRDTVGLEHVAALAFPTGVMHRLQCDTLLVKLIGPDEPPAAASAGIGFRYFTMTVPGLDAIMARCEAGGYTTVLSRQEQRPGVFCALVADPEGDFVEFLQS